MITVPANEVNIGTHSDCLWVVFKKLYLKGKAADIWAVGCVLLEMLLATPVWELDHDFGTKSLED
jgi:serine/threonine protein kinase